MVTTLGDTQTIVLDSVNQAMFAIDTARPKSCPVVFQGLRVPDTFKGMTQGVFDQNIDTL
jgi:hypothetical protein